MTLTSTSGQEAARPIRVGSWPGPSFDDNAFVSIFCEALRDAGAEVVDVKDPVHVPHPIDVLQIHWAEQPFWRGYGRVKLVLVLVRTIVVIANMKWRGVKLFWMIHNLGPHDASLFTRCLWRPYSGCLAAMVDGYVALSPATLPVITRTFRFRRNAHGIAVRHPRYPTAAILEPSTNAHMRLSLPKARVLLAFVGAIRRYKGLGRLIEAVKACAPGSVALVAAGRTNDAVLLTELKAQAMNASQIDLRPERIDEATFEGIVRACDYVVLPFVDTLHSGSIIHALSLERPVVTPATAYSCDLAGAIGTAWVRTYEGELSPAMLEGLPPTSEGKPDLSVLDPKLFGRGLVDAYREAVTRSGL